MAMQKFWILCLLITLSSWVNAQTDTGKPIPAAAPNWARLTDTTYTIRFPKNWTVDQSGLMGSRFFLFAPLDSANDVFRENFNLIVNEMGQYPNATLEFLADGARQQVESLIEGVHVEAFRLVHLDDKKYYSFEYTGKQGVFNLHWKQRYWLANNKFYVLTFTGEAQQYSSYAPLAERILSSFLFR
jgi:serine/threonine-protein kinase